MKLCCEEGIGGEKWNAAQQFARSIGKWMREDEVSRGGQRKPALICRAFCRETIGNETTLQLIMPVWECNTKSLIQAEVGKN
jgi:hypothetical protein